MLFFMFNRNLILTLLAVAAVALIILIVKHRKKKAAGSVLEDMKPSPKKDLLIGLRDNAEVFAEYYEPLYILAKGNTGRKEWVAASWLNAVRSLEGQDAFKAAFNKKFASLALKTNNTKSARKAKKIDKKQGKKCRKAAKKLISLLKKAGILRDKTLTVIADETTAEKYDVIGNTSLNANEKYDVFAPFWTLTTRRKEKIEAATPVAPVAAPAETPVAAPAETPAAAPAEAPAENDVTEAMPAAPAAPVKLTGKEKKKAKKQAKKDKKAAKKAKKKNKKNNEQFNIIENTILLTKGAVR